MLKHEPGTREGKDAEELHDMRVATRRMRAALRVFDGHVGRAAVKPYLKALRRTGRTLGTVRDLDVFHEKTMRYLGGLPEGHESDLDPLLGAWRTERDGARAVMIDYLDSQPHKRFARRFGEFLETAGAAAVEPFDADGEPLPRLVRDVLPVVLFERLAAVRAFAEWLDEPDVPLTRYHRLRIASKGLRYTLEFFEEVLGPGARPLIEDVKTLQDHLGDLQDAVVGCGVAGSFLTWGTWQPPGKRCPGPAHPVLNAPGVATYLAHRQQEIATLIEAFPPVWERVSGPDFARGVSELVAGI
jgi:CHAD domain-containing protein